MSKHRRARSRTPRTSRTPRQGRTRTSSPTSRRVALAATAGLLTFAAGWVYALDQKAVGTSQASADSRPPAADRAARDAWRGAPEAAPRDPLQGLTGISEQTLAKIPADARQLVLVTGKAGDSSESTAAFYTRPAAGADWVRGESWPARNGAKGWSTERTYGDLTSPQGVFALTDAGGLLPPPPGTRLPYDKDGAFVATGRGVNGESLAGSFDYVVAIDFNRRPGKSPLDPVKPEGERKGGNIWLHVDHDGPSQGCVGIPKEAMKKVLETLDPAAKPVIVMGPQGF
ncbi:L,D-transpeptidase family protein [Streptomyces sp. NPDC058525]|uniref:L,D-transpeptidase family protein n=1 Tax=Streptomyces sp. NPDC058525 TaxID=3346538 RepID=UPI0036619CCE